MSWRSHLSVIVAWRNTTLGVAKRSQSQLRFNQQTWYTRFGMFFNLKKGVLSVHQYWFWIGNFPIRAYSTLFALAFLLGLGVTLYIAKVEGKKHLAQHMWTLAPLLLIGGIIGARFWQVFFFDWQYYSQHPGEIIAVWHGGLSIQGGVTGAVIAGGWYIWKHKLDFWELADLVAPGLLLGQSVGRDANLMNGDAFGDPTHHNFGLLYPPSTLAYQTYGNQPLWPAEVWEGQADVILFALLLVLKQKKWPKGWLF